VTQTRLTSAQIRLKIVTHASIYVSSFLGLQLARGIDPTRRQLVGIERQKPITPRSGESTTGGCELFFQIAKERVA
jgi:hypothetical protein